MKVRLKVVGESIFDVCDLSTGKKTSDVTSGMAVKVAGQDVRAKVGDFISNRS